LQCKKLGELLEKHWSIELFWFPFNSVIEAFSMLLPKPEKAPEETDEPTPVLNGISLSCVTLEAGDCRVNFTATKRVDGLIPRFMPYPSYSDSIVFQAGRTSKSTL
jgi:hypothetical protein